MPDFTVGEGDYPVTMEVSINDEEVRRAIKIMNKEGPELVKEVLKERTKWQLAETKRWLKRMAMEKGLAGARIPPDEIVGKVSRDVYTTISNSLGREEQKDGSIRVGAQPFPSGPVGSHPNKGKPGYLAAIHQWGTGRFDYAKEFYENKLGLMVRSSARFYLVGSQSQLKGFSRSTSMMKPKQQHPGFEAIDFLGHTQEGVERNFEKDWNTRIKDKWGARVR